MKDLEYHKVPEKMREVRDLSGVEEMMDAKDLRWNPETEALLPEVETMADKCLKDVKCLLVTKLPLEMNTQETGLQ